MKHVDGEVAEAPVTTFWRHELYQLDDIRAALGLAIGFPPDDSTSDGQNGCLLDQVVGDTEQQSRLRTILSAGEAGRWRRVADPTADAEAAVAALSARAPHLDIFARLVQVNLRAAVNMAVPIFLAPVLLVGAPGVGKTWFLSHLVRILGLPFRAYAMSSATLGEGLSGSHPSWRNAAPGLVAKTLLQERLANPVFFVDELDKANSHSNNQDPFRPFYTLLEPAGSRAFVDEYLGFPIDASQVLWVLAANDASVIPHAILDRLIMIEVPDMTMEHRAVVAASLYAEANAARRHYFEATLPQSVLERLSLLSPRSARFAIEHAMARAAADGRRRLREEDVQARTSHRPNRIGFR